MSGPPQSWGYSADSEEGGTLEDENGTAQSSETHCTVVRLVRPVDQADI